MTRRLRIREQNRHVKLRDLKYIMVRGVTLFDRNVSVRKDQGVVPVKNMDQDMRIPKTI